MADHDKLILRRSELTNELKAIEEQINASGSLKGRYFKLTDDRGNYIEYRHILEVSIEGVTWMCIVNQDGCNRITFQENDSSPFQNLIKLGFTEITSTEFKEAYQKALEQLSNLVK